MRSNQGLSTRPLLPTGDVDVVPAHRRASPGALVDADDVLDAAFFPDYFALPRSVADTLLEVELFGTGPEAIRLLQPLTCRDLTPGEALEVAAGWERQSRWLSTRTAAANLAFVGTTVETGRDAERQQSSRILELALAIDCSDQ